MEVEKYSFKQKVCNGCGKELVGLSAEITGVSGVRPTGKCPSCEKGLLLQAAPIYQKPKSLLQVKSKQKNKK